MTPLEILYRDDHLIAVNKPTGWDVHRNEFNRHRPLVLQALRNQINQEVHPVHRLDGGTSGVLLFAMEKEILRFLNDQFQSRETRKIYHCITRGYAKNITCIEQLKVHENMVDAETDFKCLAHMTVPWVNEKFPQSRYSYLEAHPKTGRYHQIRRHLRFLGWPIAGDTKHGDGTHNLLWREHMNINRLLLHASSITIKHPLGHELTIEAPQPQEFTRALAMPQWESLNKTARVCEINNAILHNSESTL